MKLSIVRVFPCIEDEHSETSPLNQQLMKYHWGAAEGCMCQLVYDRKQHGGLWAFFVIRSVFEFVCYFCPTHRTLCKCHPSAVPALRCILRFVLGCILFHTSAVPFTLSLHCHILTFAAASYLHFPTVQFLLHWAIALVHQFRPDLHLHSSHIPKVHFPGTSLLLALLGFFCCWLRHELCSCSQAYFWSFDSLALFL